MSRFLRGRKPDPDAPPDAGGSVYEDRLRLRSEPEEEWVPLGTIDPSSGRFIPDAAAPPRSATGWVPLNELLR